jgi:hypothetical protein
MISIEDFLKLRDSVPIVDVRSEGEYASGHIQLAKNVPLLNNAERVAVGTDYKQKGQAEAIKTGFRLVDWLLFPLMSIRPVFAAFRRPARPNLAAFPAWR